MSECKHGMKTGCVYCHVTVAKPSSRPQPKGRPGRAARLSDKMNDRMTALKKRLREIRGE